MVDKLGDYQVALGMTRTWGTPLAEIAIDAGGEGGIPTEQVVKDVREAAVVGDGKMYEDFLQQLRETGRSPGGVGHIIKAGMGAGLQRETVDAAIKQAARDFQKRRQVVQE